MHSTRNYVLLILFQDIRIYESWTLVFWIFPIARDTVRRWLYLVMLMLERLRYRRCIALSIVVRLISGRSREHCARFTRVLLYNESAHRVGGVRRRAFQLFDFLGREGLESRRWTGSSLSTPVQRGEPGLWQKVRVDRLVHHRGGFTGQILRGWWLFGPRLPRLPLLRVQAGHARTSRLSLLLGVSIRRSLSGRKDFLLSTRRANGNFTI